MTAPSHLDHSPLKLQGLTRNLQKKPFVKVIISEMGYSGRCLDLDLISKSAKCDLMLLR